MADKEDKTEEKEDQDEAAPEADTPAQAENAEPEAPVAAAPEQPEPAQMAPEPAQAAAAPAAVASPQPMSTDVNGNPIPPKPIRTPEQEAADMDADNEVIVRDLSSGKIKPETYKSLFEKKDTLGKVGTLFGMLLSGAGSGLTHQPNALLHMMDQQIQNDLEAQKQNKSNDQNWYRLGLEHARNEASNALTNAQAAKMGSEADMNEFLNQQAGIVPKATANALNGKRAAYLQEQQNNINRMAPGPTRDLAQAQLDNVVKPAFYKLAHDTNVASTQKNINNLAFSEPDPGNPPPAKPVAGGKYDAYNKGLFAQQASRGRLFGDKAGMVPGAIPMSDQTKISEEAKALQANRDNWADAVSSFNKISNMGSAGQAPGVGAVTSMIGGLASLIPGHSVSAKADSIGEKIQDAMEQERKTQKEHLIGLIARSEGIGTDAAEKIVDSFLPSFVDSDKARNERFKQLNNHFSDLPAEKAPTMKLYPGLYYEAPKYTFSSHINKNKVPQETSFAPAKGMP